MNINQISCVTHFQKRSWTKWTQNTHSLLNEIQTASTVGYFDYKNRQKWHSNLLTDWPSFTIRNDKLKIQNVIILNKKLVKRHRNATIYPILATEQQASTPIYMLNMFLKLTTIRYISTDKANVSLTFKCKSIAYRTNSLNPCQQLVRITDGNMRKTRK